MYLDPTLLLLFPALLFGLWAQSSINKNYKKYAQVFSQKGFSAYEAASWILQNAGAYNVGIEQAKGSGLSDHFDPRANVLRLSRDVMHSTSIAAIGVAAHEAGHALQYQTGYLPIRLRSALVPAFSLGSKLAWPLFLLGLCLSSGMLLTVGLALYLLAIVFQFITLPVEFNASHRAIALLESNGILSQEEIPGAKKVLTCAAMTYVAATLNALMNFLRLFLLANRRTRR